MQSTPAPTEQLSASITEISSKATQAAEVGAVNLTRLVGTLRY